MKQPRNTRSLTREQIKNRMLEDAKAFWDAPGNPREGFDPLVNMLMEACSAEAKRIHDQIEVTHARILSRLAQLLTPEISKGPLPAHAVLMAHPNDASFTIPEKCQFLFSRKIQDELEEISFSPAMAFPSADLSVEYIAHGHQIRQYQKLYKEEIILAENYQSLPPNIIYLGIQANLELDDMKELQIFFNWDELEQERRNRYMNYLPFVSWQLGDREIRSRPGYSTKVQHELDHGQIKDYDVLHKSTSHVLELYKKHFITLEEFELKRGEDANLPEELVVPFGQATLDSLGEDLIWVRLAFPESFPPEGLESLYVQTNCVPVINRRLKEYSYRIQQQINIVAIESDNFFLAIDDISTNNGEEFVSNNSFQFYDRNDKSFTLRQGGTARFDVRDASTLLDYLLDLLRDESASFSAMGYDVLASDIEDINQIVSRIESKIHLKLRKKESLAYLILRSKKIGENVGISFWSTDGKLANDITSSTDLIPYKGADFKRNKTFLVTTSRGGRDPLSEKESLYAYREALLTRGRIVTREDIKAACFSFLGNRLFDVEIEDGYMVGKSNSNGLSRTLDIWLYPNSGYKINKEDCQELENSLNQRSTSVLPLRVFRDPDDR